MTNAPASEPRRGGNTGLKVVAVLAGIGILWISVASPSQQEREAAAEAAKLPPQKVAKCRELLVTGEEVGVIRQRPDPNRINVEETLWAQLPADVKDETLAAVSCDLWQTAMPPAGEHVVAYGYRSGKRLQMLTEVGMLRE